MRKRHYDSEGQDCPASDFAVRYAENNGRPQTEVRAGLTFDFSLH
jgi:hypothetical protein